jgi:hypothetical protein
MNEDAIKDAYDLFVNTGYNKSYENFKTLIQSNPNARKDAYDLFVSTGYNKTQKDFDELMGIGAPAPVKKKEQVSPSQQKAQPTSLATGAMGPDGEPVPSAKKGASLQEQLQSGINLAASAAVASSKPGFTPVPKEEADKALYGKAKVKEGTLGLSGGRTKDVIISSLNEDFGKLGVRFEQPQNPLSRSMGDIVATADNGQSITIQASSDGKAAESESKRLQSFLMGNSAGVEKKEVTPIEMLKMMQGGIAENEQEKFKRVYTPEMINETVKFVNDEVTKANKKLQDISGQIDEINNEAARITGITGTATPESQARMQELTASYDLLKAEFDKERENAQVISKLGVEGINIASAEHLKLLEQKGGFGKSIYNHTVEMLGNTANGILQMATLGILDEGGKYAQETIDQFKKDTKFSDTEVYEQNSNMAMQVLFSMPEWLPMAAMGPAVGTTFMFTQGVGRKVEELNNNPETKDLSQLEKLAIVSPMAYVEARLENLGLSAWLSKNKGIAASIAIKAVANVSPKAGAAGIARLINTEINNLAVKGLLNVTGASLAEAETGALQYVAESGMKELYNIAEQRQIFKQPQFGSEAWAKELAESAIMEGLGGAFVSGPINIAQQTANYAVGKSNTNETFKIVKDLLNDNIAERSMIAQLNSAVNEGKISKEKAQTTLYNFREAKSIVRDIPQDLSEDNQRKAFDLIAEKRKLTKQIEGKDPSLVDKQKTRITAIDQELKNISNAVQEQTTSEVPVQPETAVSGEVAQGEPQAEPQVVTEEGQAKEEVIPGSKGVISGIEITYPTQEQRAEREAVRNSQDYVSARSIELPVTDTEALAEDLKGEFAMVTGENPDGQPLTEEENQALNEKAQEWLTSRGYDPKPIVGKFNQAENSFFVKGMTEADAIEFAQEFNQKSVAHSGGMLYQNGSRNPRTTGDDFSFGKFEPGMDMVSIVNTTDGPRQFSVAYDFKTTIESDAVSDFDQAVNNSAQSLKMVAPDLKIIVAENTEDAQLQIAEALSAVAPTQAADVAEGFTTETRGQTVFVNGKPFAIVLDKSQADTVTIGHEVWETMLNDAFGDDQVKFKEFRDGIDSQLRLNGYGEIADALTKFSNQRGYEDVKYSEYMAELGGMLVADGFKQGSLDAKQKSLLQKIGDVINKFAQLFTGKKQFLDEATPEDILGFMVTISNKVAKGEDVSTFFREKNTQEIKDTKKVFSNRSQKIGDFDIQYFEDDAEFKDLVDRGLVVQNASIDEAGGQPVAIHQPDNLLVGNVNYKGKKIMEGNGGIYYVLKFGNVWASGKQNSAKTLANYINKSRKESTDGIGRMVLVRGSQDKMISSVQGVKAAMRILEELVFDNLISTSDFRKALTSAGKAYNIDFSGNNSAKQIQKDIEDKFMNVSDSTFAKRGDFFSTLVNEIGKLESANKNIKEIQKALGATKNIQFSKGGIRQQIGTVLTERLLIGLDSGNAYAIVEVDEDVVVKKDDQHPSYPFSIVTKSGKPPVLKVFNYRPKAVEAITTMSGEKASNAKLGLAQMGMGMGRIASDKEIVVKSRSQKNVPTVVDEVLTDDGKGNYVFVHYSDELRDTIKPMSGSNKNFTSREEVAAISSVGGVAMYYTKQGQKEQGVGNVAHTVLVPKDKVYFYGTTERGKVSNDPENFEPEARRRFQEYKNRGNESRPTEYAFDSNNAAAWVGKVASENGYDMLVTNWGAPMSYRAQTVKELTPEAEYTGFKQIPEPKYEVGDEVFLYGKYAILTDVKPDVLTYEVENAFGGVDSGKFPLTVMTRDKIIMVQKAKPTVTTKSQKIVVNTIPGYERMMGEVEGILDKTMNSRDGSYNRATASAIGYIQKSKVYINADDSQREQIIRDFVKLRGEKFKVAPSVGKILGQIKDVKKVTVNEKNALKDQIKLEAKAARDAAAFVKQLRMQISGRLKMMAGRGVISAKQASTILARYDRMNILNPDMRDRFVDYMANVFQSAEYADKVKEATRLRKTIRKAAKNPDNQAENSKMAKSFAEIDPSRVENIDDYLNNAEQMLKAVSRKTGDVKMRSLVNMTDMFSYVNKEIQAQREQIKNEILSKYQDLVDAGVLDSKMTINEIQKVVEAIEEKKDESEAKAKEAKEAVKQMMDELSPILLQIARTGEDPFTGDPIDLTPDEKRDLVRLAKMDLDSLSLADSLKAVEYANNFISNGIFSGIGAIVSINEGSLEPAKLKKEGVMSLRLRKYFSPGAGRKWAEQLGTLTMLNKLLFVSNEKAIMVANASGESGIANGKAKAIKIVEKAVKEYTDKFSSLKDFRTGENIIERGILAFVSRTVIGDKFQVQKEFNRRKRLVEETIQALTDPNNSTDADIKKGELIEKVYDKILKDAKNVNDVRAKVSEVNKKLLTGG